ncbi:hypothetical protein BD770DRAFT_112381 [Pilaira anomala]|nr:hypothetical protein BD770DRAFT_112381 [Pilaira anomala]
MIVAFGFTGVLTALTVMSDIEVLDITTWSWTSVYTPSAGYNTGGGGHGLDNGIGGGNNRSAGNNNVPNSPSISIVAGAVTGGLVVFVLILVAFYFLNCHQKRRNNKSSGEFSEHSTFSNLSLAAAAAAADNTDHHQAISSRNQHEMIEIRFKDPPSATEPFEYYNSQSRRPSAQIPHPLQINTALPPTRSDTINTSTTASSGILLPSPWSRIRSSESISESGGGCGGGGGGSSSDSNSKRIVIKQPRFPSDWMVRRATSTPTHHPMQNISISKPDDKFYPDSSQAATTNLRRAATVCELNKSSISLLTDNSSTATITNKNIKNNYAIHHTSTAIIPKETIEAAILNHNCSNNQSEEEGEEEEEKEEVKEEEEEEEGEDDNKFDRQEFILMSNEVAKGEH